MGLRKRLYYHKRTATHTSSTYLVAEWIRKIGPENVEIRELEICDYPHRHAREEHFIQLHRTLKEHGGANYMLGSRFTAAGRADASRYQSGKVLSQDHREAIGRGVKASEAAAAQRARMHELVRGRPQSPEHRAAVSAAKKGTAKSSQAGKAAMHVRWHVNRGMTVPECPFCG
jgi:hypothetical protein